MWHADSGTCPGRPAYVVPHLGSDCGPYVDPPRRVTGLRGSPLVVLLPVGRKKAPSDVWETLRALYRGKEQLFLQRSAR